MPHIVIGIWGTLVNKTKITVPFGAYMVRDKKRNIYSESLAFLPTQNHFYQFLMCPSRVSARKQRQMQTYIVFPPH